MAAVQIALAYVPNLPAAIIALVGPETIAQMDLCVQAAAVAVSPAELQWLRGGSREEGTARRRPASHLWSKGFVMIFDSHAHLKHGDAAGTEYSPEAIVRTMDAAGIARSVVFAMSTTTRRSIEMAEQAVAQFPERLVPYVYALPSYERPVVQELEEAIGERGFKGIKIHAGECSLAPYIIDPVMELAGRHQVPCLIDLKGWHGVAASLAQRFPGTTLIIAHLGLYLCTDNGLIDRFIALAEQRPNVYLDVSGVVMGAKAREAVARVGAQRVLWGTDGPHKAPDTAAFATLELDRVRMLHLDPKDEAMVLGGSIAALLRV